LNNLDEIEYLLPIGHLILLLGVLLSVYILSNHKVYFEYVTVKINNTYFSTT
jgi:hypothetical protein